MRFTQTAESIRRELREIPGAMRYEPQVREHGGGEEPRNMIPLWAPESSAQDGLAEVDSRGGAGEEPGVREFVDAVASPAAVAELAEAIEAGGEEEDRRIREQVARDSVDALGWYATVHQDAYQWGVYIKAEGVLWLARTVFQPVTNDPVVAVRLAMRAVHDHELMHFAEDWAIAQLELLFDRPFWWPMHESPAWPKGHVRSERLANGYMLRRARSLPRDLRCRDAYSGLSSWTLTQGDGYRHGHELVGTQRKMDEACGLHLIEATAAAKDVPWVAQAELHRLYPLSPHIDWQYCPVRVVSDSPALSALFASLFIRQVPRLEETDGFLRLLNGLGAETQRAWRKTRALLSQTTQLKGLDFKPWPPRGKDWYSVRVSRGARAHLRFEPPTQRWFAEEIGCHKAMGHG